MNTTYDCIVIGAGFAGLHTARQLTAQNHRVLVIEARDRIGGRIYTQNSASGLAVDVGGQWLGPTQTRVLKLTDELGLTTWPQYTQGKNLLKLEGRLHRFAGDVPAIGLFSLVEMQILIWRVEAMAKGLDRSNPWQADQARTLDQTTVAVWLDRHCRSRKTRGMIKIAVNAVFCCEPEALSMLQFLFYLRSADGLMPLVTAAGGAQDRRITGGAQAIASGMQRELINHGAELRLACPVRAIEQSDDRVAVVTDSEHLQSKRVVVALSPADSQRIHFSIPLPTRRRQLMQRMPTGSVIKCILIYDQPFWRAQGLSGEMVSDESTENTPLRMCFDGSPPDSELGVLVGFILGDAAPLWSESGPDSRRRAVSKQLVEFFGPAAAHPREYIDKDWCRDDWTHGCYVGLMPPGVMSSIGSVIRQPCGHVHWAGTETASQWNGYMEGALQSAERAAQEVTDALR